MIREMDLSADTDGRIYGLQDMAKLGCRDCEGCSECCRSVGDTIVIDPWDMYMLQQATGLSGNEIFASYLEMGVVDGIILPHMKMQEESGACGFLNEEGRCGIHGFRPGFCRLYPLGRLYEKGDYKFILLKDQCRADRLTKVKISKWLGIRDEKSYHAFVLDWHKLLQKYQEKYYKPENEEALLEAREISLMLLKSFYLKDYDRDRDFYSQYEERRMEAFGL